MKNGMRRRPALPVRHISLPVYLLAISSDETAFVRLHGYASSKVLPGIFRNRSIRAIDIHLPNIDHYMSVLDVFPARNTSAYLPAYTQIDQIRE
jgi:hypothetical protein